MKQPLFAALCTLICALAACSGLDSDIDGPGADGGPLRVEGGSVIEGSGSTVLSFEITLRQAFAVDVVIEYRSRDGSALAGSDYLPVHGQLVMPAGQTRESVEVIILGDNDVEGDEVFFLDASLRAGAPLPGSDSGLAIIIDDDFANG